MGKYSISELCAALNISRAGYYAWKRCKISQREKRDQALLVHIKAIFHEFKFRYGAPRIHSELQEHGIHCGIKRVARIMKENQLVAKGKKKFKLGS